MKELEEFFKDVKRIADSMETIVKLNEKEIKDIAEATCSCLNAQHEQLQQPVETTTIVSAFDIPQTPPVATGLPVSNTVETYTQDQLATIMGRAVDAGKMADIQKIMAGFGVSSFVELPTEKYNALVLKLKEIGVDV